jgi:hypothetical protein
MTLKELLKKVMAGAILISLLFAPGYVLWVKMAGVVTQMSPLVQAA